MAHNYNKCKGDWVNWTIQKYALYYSRTEPVEIRNEVVGIVITKELDKQLQISNIYNQD